MNGANGVWLKDASFEREHDPDLGLEQDDADKHRHRRIRCPKCRWEPRRSDLWGCKCGYAWNTFDTAGLCPSCGYQWTMTACLRCHEWSPHKDWYETPDDSGSAPS